jgi:hypothetical protein
VDLLAVANPSVRVCGRAGMSAGVTLLAATPLTLAILVWRVIFFFELFLDRRTEASGRASASRVVERKPETWMVCGQPGDFWSTRP